MSNYTTGWNKMENYQLENTEELPWLENNEKLPLAGGKQGGITPGWWEQDKWQLFTHHVYTVYKNNGHTSVVYNCPVRWCPYKLLGGPVKTNAT